MTDDPQRTGERFRLRGVVEARQARRAARGRPAPVGTFTTEAGTVVGPHVDQVAPSTTPQQHGEVVAARQERHDAALERRGRAEAAHRARQPEAMTGPLDVLVAEVERERRDRPRGAARTGRSVRLELVADEPQVVEPPPGQVVAGMVNATGDVLYVEGVEVARGGRWHGDGPPARVVVTSPRGGAISVTYAMAPVLGVAR